MLFILVSRQELVPFLVQQIADQKRIDASISGAPLVAESSQGQGSAKEPGTSEVQLLLPADAKKQRKQTKQIFLDRGNAISPCPCRQCHAKPGSQLSNSASS